WKLLPGPAADRPQRLAHNWFYFELDRKLVVNGSNGPSSSSRGSARRGPKRAPGPITAGHSSRIRAPPVSRRNRLNLGAPKLRVSICPDRVRIKSRLVPDRLPPATARSPVATCCGD